GSVPRREQGAREAGMAAALVARIGADRDDRVVSPPFRRHDAPDGARRAMKFCATPIDGAYVIEQTARGDDRGFFARMWCTEEFGVRGLSAAFVQCNN